MKKGFTDITVVLDRSGSMDSVKNDTIGGFNTFLKEQREAEGEAVISLVQFDDHYDVVYTNSNVKTVADLTDDTFVPRGWTALLDAIGKTIITTGERLAKMKEEDRPENVIFVIITDGAENSSKEYRRDKINEMITHQKETYNWNFVFLGANQDAISVGTSLGLSVGNSLTYAANSLGTQEAFASVSKSMLSYRNGDISMVEDFFMASDREAQAKAGA